MPTNFIFILADDLGYADLGCYGGRAPTSPNIDRRAAEGMRCTRGYANSAVCSPTRFALATGRWQYRLRGAVPPGWSFGHKTGTGQDLAGRTAGYNDVGILTAPDGKAYSIAVMIGDTPRPIKERQELMQGVVAAVVAQHR